MSEAMQLNHSRTRMTVAEYLAGEDDDVRSELIYRELHGSPRAGGWHQDLEYYLSDLLRSWVNAHKLGWVCHDLDMVLDRTKNLVYRPDILFLSHARANQRKRDRVFGPADLCVEILSPSDWQFIRNRKFTDYERYGVGWYWVVDRKDMTITEYELVQGRFLPRAEITESDWFEPGLFPGLVFRLSSLVEGDLKATVKGKARKLV